jgi:hypothetical protein
MRLFFACFTWMTAGASLRNRLLKLTLHVVPSSSPSQIPNWRMSFSSAKIKLSSLDRAQKWNQEIAVQQSGEMQWDR